MRTGNIISNSDTNGDRLLQPDIDLIDQVRSIAAKKLQELLHDIETIVRPPCEHQNTNNTTSSITIPSWVNQYRNTDNQTFPSQTNNENITTRSDQCLFFDYTGFIHVPGFVSSNMCSGMKEEIHHIVETQWDPNQKLGDTFGTSEKENVSRGNYFLESANQVHFFTEPKAIENDTAASTGTMNQNENDLINTETTTKGTESSICSKEVEKKKHAETSKSQHYQHTPQRLKSEYCTPQTKIYALNKIGHGLHLIPDSTFQQYTQSNVVRQLLKDLGWRDPVVPQSMYIFKQPNHIGGIVNSHQDSTFLYTNPYPTCIGLWLALDDATIENGCLWIRPCSHNNTNDDIEEDMSDNNMESLPSLPRCNVRRHYRRNVLHFGRDTIYNRSNNPTGDIIQQPMFEMVQLFHDATVPWDGSLPGIDTTTTTAATNMEYVYESLLQAGFIPIECKAGDLLAFTGTLDHLSLGNSQHHQCSHPDLRDHSHSHGQSPLLSSSSSSRHTFQLHIVEGPSQGIEWSPLNWLQYPPNQSFMRLNSE